MDAKSKAEFINSVASGETRVCPECGTANAVESKNCASCGKELVENRESTAPAFAPVVEEKNAAASAKYAEPENVFAQGLPEWSLEPPQVMVRRH